MALKKKPVTGMKDILPREMEIRNYVMNLIRETYGMFGFTNIETPCVEHIENLSSKQGVTDRERAQIALSYHCLSLLDVFWVKEENEKIRFEDIMCQGVHRRLERELLCRRDGSGRGYYSPPFPGAPA